MATSQPTAGSSLADAVDRLALSIRHESHRDPRLSGDEQDTADRLVRTVRAFVAGHAAGAFAPIRYVERLGGAGVLLAAASGAAKAVENETDEEVDAATAAGELLAGRRVVLLRAELDGLPIDEVADPAAAAAVPQAHRSRVPGVSMKCGHDGHHASMIAAFLRLAAAAAAAADAPSSLDEDPQLGPAAVALVLQPAEETGLGARRVVADERFLRAFARVKDVTPISYHNVPGLPLGAVRTRVGTFAKASTGVLITLAGRTAHAATPEHGVSPASVVAKAVLQLGTVGCELPESAGSLSTITHFSVGEPTFGVAPGDGRIHMTMRADRWDDVAAMVRDTERTVEALTAAFNDSPNAQHPAVPLRTAVELREDFRETANDAATVDVVEAAARRLGMDFERMPLPMSWSEDFGVFCAHFGKGAMVALGSGEKMPGLHTIGYDYPDELLAPAAALFEAVARRLLTLSTSSFQREP